MSNTRAGLRRKIGSAWFYCRQIKHVEQALGLAFIDCH